MNWKEAVPMNEKRALMGATKHNGVLVVSGGYNETGCIRSAEFYELPMKE